MAQLGSEAQAEAEQDLRDGERYRFGGFELDLVAFELRSGGQTVALRGKTIEVLAYLVRHRERLVLRDELMQALWPDVHVATGSISQAIWELRRALRDERNGPALIQTRYGRGYRFVAQVAGVVAAGPSPGDAPPHVGGTTRNCR